VEAIPLSTLLDADFNPAEFKLHCAVYNGEAHPIEVLGNDPERWKSWNSWRPVNDDFNRQYIFWLAQDRHDPTLWLFGGIWEVVRRRPEPRAHSYDIVLPEDLMGPFVRRLYVRLELKGRNRRRSMETCLADMTGRRSWRNSSSVSRSRGMTESTTRSQTSRPSLTRHVRTGGSPLST